MHTITLDGKEYIIRCDLNVIEKIYGKYNNSLETFLESGIEGIKAAVAWMINEHNIYIGNHENVTPEWVGARIIPHEYSKIAASVIACISDSITPKN